MKRTRWENLIHTSALATPGTQRIRRFACRSMAAGIVALLSLGTSIIGTATAAHAVEVAQVDATVTAGTAGVASAAHSSFLVSGFPVVANGSDAHWAVVIVRDIHGDPVAGVEVTFLVEGGATGSRTVVSDENGHAAGGDDPVFITSTKTGKMDVSASIDGVPVPGKWHVVFIAGPAVAASSELSVSAGAVAADGKATHTATVTAKDALGNPAKDATVSFVVPGVVLASAPAPTDEHGVTTVTLTSETAGNFAVRANIRGKSVAGSGQTVGFAHLGATLQNSTIVSSVDRIRANGTAAATATVTLRDVQGNPVGPGQHVAIATTAGTISETADNGDGSYTATLTATVAGTAILSFAIDGETAEQVTRVQLINATPPAAPEVAPSNGTAVTGKTNPWGYVTVADENGKIIATGFGDRDGSFALEIAPRIADGTLLDVTAIDTEDNESIPTRITVDGVAPAPPHADPSNGTLVVGTAEPHAIVTILDARGNAIATTTADDGGAFSASLDPVAKTGDAIFATARDAAGNESGRIAVRVNSDTPAAPTVDRTDGTVLTGSSEAGLTITVTDAAGSVIASGVAGASGAFSIALAPVVPAGEALSVFATNEVGTKSAPTEVVVAVAELPKGETDPGAVPEAETAPVPEVETAGESEIDNGTEGGAASASSPQLNSIDSPSGGSLREASAPQGRASLAATGARLAASGSVAAALLLTCGVLLFARRRSSGVATTIEQ